MAFNFDNAPKDKHPNPANKDNASNATVFKEAMVEASKRLNKKMENPEDAELDKEMKRQLNQRTRNQYKSMKRNQDFDALPASTKQEKRASAATNQRRMRVSTHTTSNNI